MAKEDQGNFLLKSVQLPDKRYERYGECNQCGDCCDNEDCEHFIDRKCAIFGDPDRPLKCTLFPEVPNHPFKRCSYYFLDRFEQEITK